MPESDDSPQPADDALPTNLAGVSPDELFARGMQSARMSGGGAHGWEPPTPAEVAHLFPSYEILSLLGRGGMGAVYKARQTALDRLVAIKLLPLEISVDQAFADRFRREARAMAKLNHPHIISVHDFGQTAEGHLFFAMEFVEGANLHDIIHGGELTPEQTLSIAAQICTALAYAHGKGVVHRDMKPANVMIDTESQVKVADFGLARLTDPTAETYGTTVTGTVMGTPDYMAPEQTRGMNVDHRADIYSLGVMLYEMLCRETPRGAFDLPSARTGCDQRLDAIVLKAMQQAPDRRYQSTQEMKADVESARTPLPASPPPAAAPSPLPKALPRAPKTADAAAAAKKGRAPLWIASAAVVAILLGIVVGVVKHRGNDGSASAEPMNIGMPAESTPASPLPAVSELINLLPIVDVKRDATTGEWSVKPEGLALDLPADFGVLELPYEPPEEYDFEVAFTPTAGDRNPNLYLRAGGSGFAWKTNAHGATPPLYGFDLLDGKLMTANPEACATNASSIENGKRYTTRVEVRREGLRGLVNGVEMMKWAGDFRRFGMEEGSKLRNERAIGVGSYKRAVIFHSIEVREVTGTGRITAGTAPASAATKDAPVVSTPGMKPVPAPVTGWISLFDGKSLDGWKASEKPGAFSVQDGKLVVHGSLSHLFYDGPVQLHDFKNFEVKADIMTKKGANSGFYFHTEFQQEGFPQKGFEVQVNNTQSDPKKTAGLYNIEDNLTAPAQDDEWFTMTIRVEGRHVVTKVNEKVIIDWTEPEPAVPPALHKGRIIAHGTFAIQAHDSGSEVHYKNIFVRPLP